MVIVGVILAVIVVIACIKDGVDYSWPAAPGPHLGRPVPGSTGITITKNEQEKEANK